GASPIVWRDLVIVPNDQDGPSSLVALDLRSGETVWSTPRESGNTAYGTPLILEAEGTAPQLIVSSQAMGVTSLDPATGTLNWQSGPLPQRTVGSPVFAGGLIYQTCGQAGRGVLMVGVDPFAASDEKRVVFEEKKLLPYVPTPVAYKGHLYLWNDNGVVLCVDLKTRKPVWTERVGGNYSGSPVCVNGLLYAVSEEGEVVVVRAAPEFELLGRSSLGDRSHATPAVADGRMYFRTFRKVVRLAPTAAN
ncbi:MAG TPA: PQQ-binding-like beta-propeller repeat protein, partial [Planctomycetaceae bacterium]